MARLSFRCSDDLLRRVDEARGLVPRETWLRMAMLRAVEQALGSGERDVRTDRSFPPAPAEQPEMRGFEPIVRNAVESGNAIEGLNPRVRSSAARPFRPVPKKGER